MARIRFDFGTLKLDAELLDTPTAKAVVAALPLTSAVLTWGEEVISMYRSMYRAKRTPAP